MIFRGLAAILAAAVAVPAGAQTPAELREMLAAVLAREATHPRGPTCVAMQTQGLAFDDLRNRLRSLRESWPPPTTGAATGRQRFDWLRAPVPHGVGLNTLPKVDAETAARLDAAANTLLASESGPSRPVAMPPLPGPLRPSGGAAACRGELTLTAPGVAGDLAFIDTGYVCGGLCGNGWLYALRREDGHWRVVALAYTWVS